MRNKRIILFTGLALLGIVYSIWKLSPAISKSLEKEGFKLVTKAENKQETYERILERYKDEINQNIKLDDFLVASNKKWLALSFWCDVETNRKNFLLNLDNYKKYCVMSFADYLMDGDLKKNNSQNENASYVDLKVFDDSMVTYKKLFQKYNLKFTTNLNDNHDSWINWCKKRPYLRHDNKTKNIVRYYCFRQEDANVRDLIALNNFLI